MTGLAPLIIAGAILTSAACAEAQDNILTVAAMRDGRADPDGRPVGDLNAALPKAAPGGTIWHHRAGAEQTPSEAQIDAFIIPDETAEAQKMRTGFSPTADSSSIVDDQRRIIPRTVGP